MIDRTIKYYNFIMKLEEIELQKSASLPSDYSFRMYEDQDEEAWAEIEYSINDFQTKEAALKYFTSKYLKYPLDLKKRCIFVLNKNKEPIGSCMAWFDEKNGKNISSLHWLAVKPEFQNLGIGSFLLEKTLSVFKDLSDESVYLHTQPWSYKAIKLYLNFGFIALKEETFSDFRNEYKEAMMVLKELLDPNTYQKLEKSAK